MENEIGIADLAAIPIRHILALLKVTKLHPESNSELELIYKQTRQLLCDSSFITSLLTNPPPEVFATLMTSILDPKIQSEVIEIFVRLLTSPTLVPMLKTIIASEMVKLWKSEYSNYKTQTDLVIDWLYKHCPKNKKLWKRVAVVLNLGAKVIYSFSSPYNPQSPKLQPQAPFRNLLINPRNS
jgi:hypothetical protein